jgi:signal transduction histidine kinase
MFKRWRLVQDSQTGMVVLFGVLDQQQIATQLTNEFNEYFDSNLLRDMAVELKVPVTASSNDGLRYTFLLERGKPDLSREMSDDHTIMHQRLSKFLKIAGSRDMPNNAIQQPLPDVLFMDEAEFNQKMTEYETNHNHNKNLSLL